MGNLEHVERDWDDEFANMAHIPGSEALPDLWSANASKYRDELASVELSVPYGSHARESMDIFWPEGAPKGLLVFVHGGYWIRLDKSYWSDLAEGARSQGWAVCMPSYVLAPEVNISHITKRIAEAITTAAKLVQGPIRLAGHSAGGHLVSRMICDDTPLSKDVLDRLEHVVSISGVHDLRPLLKTKMNEDFRLDLAEATAESPVLHTPIRPINLTCWVGGGERPEFIRQSQLFAQMWDGLGATTHCVVDQAHDHFSVIEGLKDPQSPLTRAVLKSVE